MKLPDKPPHWDDRRQNINIYILHHFVLWEAAKRTSQGIGKTGKQVKFCETINAKAEWNT
jgi:hypothetical protein